MNDLEGPQVNVPVNIGITTVGKVNDNINDFNKMVQVLRANFLLLGF